MLTIAVITISDRAHRGEYEDRSGPIIVSALRSAFSNCRIHSAIVPDEPALIRQTIEGQLDCDYIITTGGTGISPRDTTPEVTAAICSHALPGISEWLRRESAAQTPYAVFSRGYAGICGKSIIINLPGSVNAVTLCANLLLPVLEHGKEMLHGASHEHGKQ